MVIFNLILGVNDIKRHRWFKNFSWDDLMKKKIKPSYVPVVKSLGDVSNFDEYPDSGVNAQDIKPSLDPFLTWWFDRYISTSFTFTYSFWKMSSNSNIYIIRLFISLSINCFEKFNFS